MPGPANTSSNSLRVKFTSDGAGSGAGFRLRYSELTNGCGGSILLSPAAPEAAVQSPGYPNAPPTRTECIWVVVAPPGERIHMDIDNIDVKPSRGYGVELQTPLRRLEFYNNREGPSDCDCETSIFAKACSQLLYRDDIILSLDYNVREFVELFHSIPCSSCHSARGRFSVCLLSS